MAVSIEDIKKLRAMTGAGLADVKKALTEAEGDYEKAKELIRERGLAIAAKRSDRETSNGCVLVKQVDGFAAMVAIKCETDFVANGQDFIALVQEILDAAVANKCKSLDEVKALKLANGEDAATAVQQRSGVTGEKMELDGYNFLEGENISVYDHMNKHTLATIVQLNENNEDAGHKVAMQVAAMKPVALDEASIPQSVKDEEFKVAVEKTKEEQIEKAVVAAIKKAGINANLVDSEDHIESNIKKGWLTREEADKAIEIRNTVAAEKAANLNEDMIQNIAKGRLNKFFKENCLVDQEFQFGDGDKQSVSEWLKAQSKDLKIVAYKRFTPELNVAEVASSGSNIDVATGYKTGYTSPGASTNVSSVEIDAAKGIVTIAYTKRVQESGSLVLVPFTGTEAAGAGLPDATKSFSPVADSIKWKCMAKGAAAPKNVTATAGTLEARYAPAECR